MPWTPLHDALGEPPAAPLSYEMFVRAIEQAVHDSDVLDWKAVPPGRTEPLREEYAKDVAAMANTGGGLIV